MIHEYALEPELVASWHDRLKGRFFISQFGSDKGKVVSRYPKKWKRLVWEAFDDTFSGPPSKKETARGRIEELVKQLTMPVVKRPGYIWDDSLGWLTNAENEHTRKPFHAILARDNPRRNTNIILEDAIVDGTPELWNTPGTRTVKRTAEAMAECVAPMLRCATKVLFVDPHFRATEERFRKPLAAFVRIIGTRASDLTIELHTADRDGAPIWEKFQKECRAKLPPILPAGATLTVHRWKNREDGDKMHNRYILTNLGGVEFGHGLDEGDPGTTDDVSRFEAGPYNRRWNDYAGPDFAYDRDGEPFSVQGTSDTS